MPSNLTTKPSSTPDLRALRIALNATPTLSRPALYRLAQDLDAWAGSPEPPGPPDRRAAALGVPRTQMRRALAILAEAPAIAAREREAAGRLGARLIVLGDPDYPADLHHLALPPPVLCVRGELPLGPAVAMVGSRRTDAYGQEVAELFAGSLAAAGVTIVSGFARGIDAAAHRGALAAEGGRTVAVLGCGLGVDYPAGHERLGREIAAQGALLSEFPCGLSPRSWHFPMRNRVIAALSAGTLVVQAAPRSGSLLTARWAADLGREVWAIPGRIFDERSLGPNALIQDGAPLVQHPRDILEALRPSIQFPLREPTLRQPEPVAEAIEEEPVAGFPGTVLATLPPGALRLPEEIAAGLEAPVDQVLGALLELELAGRVRRHPGSAYGRA
ncbi:MAG TPA: DNA-processing protein DprA [Thermoanaerobaculia bacterium]|nr:DNA-processing protein DprA [Thermoanaerobaculia bacterium]